MWLYIYGYADQASAVCVLAEAIPFTGNFVFWTPVEALLVLGARIHREKGRLAAAAACLAKVAQPIEWRFSDLSSLFLIRAIGEGQRDMDGRPVDAVRTEARAVEYLERLRAAP